MGDLNESWRIQEFNCTEKHSSKLNSSWSAALRGILACVVLLNLPILLLLSVLGIAFLFPFSFVFVVYSVVNELLSVLLDENRPPFQFHSEDEHVCSDDSGKEEGFKQDYAFVESKIEASKEFKEVHEYRNRRDDNVDSSIRMTSPFLSWESSGEYGDLEQLLAPPQEKETNDEGNELDYDFVESRTEASEEYKEVNEYRNKTDENAGSSIRITSPFLSWGSSGEYGNLEQLLAPPSEKETTDKLQEDREAVEGKGQFRQIEPEELVSINKPDRDLRKLAQFTIEMNIKNIIRETMEICEAVRNEGEAGIESIQESMEESTSIKGTVRYLERVKLLFVEEDRIDGVSRLQTINEQLENCKPDKMKKGDAFAIERTASATMKLISPHNVEKMNTVGDNWNATYKSMYHS